MPRKNERQAAACSYGDASPEGSSWVSEPTPRYIRKRKNNCPHFGAWSGCPSSLFCGSRRWHVALQSPGMRQPGLCQDRINPGHSLLDGMWCQWQDLGVVRARLGTRPGCREGDCSPPKS